MTKNDLANNVQDLPTGIKILSLFYFIQIQLRAHLRKLLCSLSHNVTCGAIKSKKNSCWQKFCLHWPTTISKTDLPPNESSICVTHCCQMIRSGVTSRFGFSSSVCTRWQTVNHCDNQIKQAILKVDWVCFFSPPTLTNSSYTTTPEVEPSAIYHKYTLEPWVKSSSFPTQRSCIKYTLVSYF